MTRHFYYCPDAGRPGERWQRAFPDAHVVGAVPDLLAQACGSDVLWLHAAHDGWSALRRAGAQQPGLRCVMLSSTPARREAAQAIDQGARAYCHAHATSQQLREVALVVQHGGVWLGPDLMEVVARSAQRFLPHDDAQPAQFASLSQRERDVARAVTQGRSNKEVAREMGITERTVKAHLGAVFQKLRVRDRVQLMLLLAESMHEAGKER